MSAALSAHGVASPPPIALGPPAINFSGLGEGRQQVQKLLARPSRVCLSSANLAKRDLTCRAGKPTKVEKGDVTVGVRWDGAMNRWVRDDRYAGFSPETMNVKPMVGDAYPVWPVVYSHLESIGLKSIEPAEALKLQKSGAVILDVREEFQYEADHIPGAVNVPMFRKVQGKTAMHQLKKAVAGIFGMSATERNSNFAEDCINAIGKNKKVIVVCSRGGSMERQVTKLKNNGRVKSFDDPDREFGLESRSLKAAYELSMAGFKNLVHLKGGMSQYRFDGYETVAE